MISRVSIRNFKCLRKLDVELGPFNVLIGPNDSGKSSFLDALFYLGRTTRELLSPVFSGPWSVDRLTWFKASEPGFSIKVSLKDYSPGAPEAEYSLALGYNESNPIVETESLTVGSREVFSTKKEIRQTRLSTLGQTDPDASRFSQALARTMNYQFDPRELRKASPFTEELEPHLKYNGFGLPSVLDYILSSHRERFDLIEEQLLRVVPSIRRIVLKRAMVEEKGQALSKLPGKMLAFTIGENGFDIAAPLVSDGVLLFLAFLTLVYSPESPSLILLEEPENGVYPHNLRFIVEMLRQLSHGLEGSSPAQIILTTHSPYLLDFALPEEVIVFGRGEDNSSQCKRLTLVPKLQERLREFKLGEIWYNLDKELVAVE